MPFPRAPAPHASPAAPEAAACTDSNRPAPERLYWALLVAGTVIATALAFLWVRSAGSGDEFHRAALTRLAGRETQPAVSPDGTQVAFVWEQEDGASGIWVQAAGSDSPRRVTPTAGAYSSPCWSPDARQLAYLRLAEDFGEAVIAPAAGGQERVLARVQPYPAGLASRHLDWSPDGRWLVLNDADAPHGALTLFLLSIGTGERRRLTQPDRDLIGDTDPRFSADGTQICFIRMFHRASHDVFTVASSGGAPVRLTSYAARMSGLDWGSQGNSLVFASDKSGEYRLWSMRWPAVPGSAPRAKALYADFPIQFSIARRSPSLVYTSLAYDLNIWRLDLAARPGSPAQWTRVVASSAQDVSQQYSPDGSRICFRSDRSGEEQLWVADADGGNPVQVTRGTLHPSVGRWAPDGRSIVFNDARNGRMFVARMTADGAWQVVPAGLNGIHPVYSPDGRWIYAGTTGMVRIPASGGPAVELSTARSLSLGTSAEGTIYFVREPSATALWRLKPGAREPEPVLEGLVPYCTSCWALAPQGVYYLGAKRDAPGRQALYFHDFAARSTRLVVDYPEPVPPIGTGPFSLSPDGRYLLCVRVAASNSDIFRVEPFR